MKYIIFNRAAIFIAIFLTFSFSYFALHNTTISFDERLREFFFQYRGEIKEQGSVVIVDIDEKSIKAIGQWPFSRDYLAQVLINLTNAGVGIVGLDIIFSENDRSSPALMAQKLGITGEFIDNDEVLGEVIANTPTIVGYFFSENSEYTSLKAPKIPANFSIDKSAIKHLISSKGVVKNIEPIQNSAYSSGFFNAYSSNHGKITKMPLILSYQDKIYPSLSFEMIRIASQTQDVKIHSDEYGVVGIELDNISIPTDESGFLYVNFRGAKNSFKYLSFVDILTNSFDPKDIEGKFVLVGTSAITLADLRATVYDLATPGVEIHANIIDNILSGDFLYKPSYIKAIDIVTIFFLSVVLGFTLLRLSAISIFPIIITLSVALYLYYYHLLIDKGLILNLFYPITTIITTSIVAVTINYLKEQRLKNIIKNKFSKKVSTAVVNELLSREDDCFRATNKEITIFFSDIRGFTTLSEKIGDPERLIKILNLYMEPMSDEIIKSGGTIDKFIGDAIMAYWNAPNRVENHADCALKTAIEQINALKSLNKELKRSYDISLQIGIGIHTGVATVGEMGSSGRSDYTIIGDSVNLASRIEGLSKYFGVEILISEDTKDSLKEQFILRELGSVRVKGKTSAVKLYELVLGEFKEKESYEEALELFSKKEFLKAKEQFEKLQNIESLKINELYIKRCEEYILNPKKGFVLEFVMDSK